MDVTEKAYLDRDFENFALWFHLPQTVGTFEGDKCIETQEQLRSVFRSMCTHFESLGVVALRRRVIEAKFLDPDVVQATFVSQHLMRGHVLGDETVAHGLLKYVQGRWQIAESRYASENQDFRKALQDI
ncbi:MAG: hypothetical protein AAF509_01450 [Pseudomonadota bacterium]